MIKDIGLLLFRLEARAIRLELQHCDFLIISRGAKAHLMHWLRKPDPSLLHDASQRRVGIVSSYRKGLHGKFEYGAPHTFMSGGNTLAIARFPKPGISANSDQIKAAALARLLRGVSIGFIPKKWSFSKDPSRPLGVDFSEICLIEFSLVSIPANPDCYVLGSVASSQSSPSTSDAKAADRRREARVLAAQARARIAAIDDEPALTREQRMAEARNLRRIAMEINR
jgi:hypothetical protein